jgi:hypothetical protein
MHYFANILLDLFIYFRYSGDMREIGQAIDEMATAIWENVRWLNILIQYTVFTRRFQFPLE